MYNLELEGRPMIKSACCTIVRIWVRVPAPTEQTNRFHIPLTPDLWGQRQEDCWSLMAIRLIKNTNKQKAKTWTLLIQGDLCLRGIRQRMGNEKAQSSLLPAIHGHMRLHMHDTRNTGTCNINTLPSHKWKRLLKSLPTSRKRTNK